MYNLFKNDEHEKKFNELISVADVKSHEYLALFFIIAGNNGLYARRNKIYDFTTNQIKLDFNNDGDVLSDDLYLSSSEVKLLELGIQLYNGSGTTTIMDIFNSLDVDNIDLAINAIKLRLDVL